MTNLKIEISGFIHAIEPEKQFDNFKVQRLLVRVPARVNEFNEPVGKEKIFPIQAMNDKINMLFSLSHGDKVIVECFVDSRSVLTNTEENYFLQLNLYKIELVEGK